MNMFLQSDKTPEELPKLNKRPCKLVTPARLMTFTSQGDSLVVVATSGRIYVMSVDSGHVEHSITPVSGRNHTKLK